MVAGDCCAILAENSARWCATYLGILRLGAVAVPFDTTYKPEQVAELLADSGATVQVSVTNLFDSAYRNFVAVPNIGRLAMVQLKYAF